MVYCNLYSTKNKIKEKNNENENNKNENEDLTNGSSVVCVSRVISRPAVVWRLICSRNGPVCV